MGIPWSFKRNFTGAKEIKDTNDYLSRIGRAIGSLDSMPVGFNMPWWSDTLPSNKYMFMEGQSLASYPEARAVFGGYLPDLRGRVMVHKSADTEFNAIKKTGGSKNLQQHNHTLDTGTFYTNTYPSTAGGFNGTVSGGNNYCNPNVTSTANAGTGNAGNLQPYIVCRYIAKVLP